MNFNSILPLKLNIPNLNFGSKALIRPVTKPVKDGFVSNPIYEKFGTKEQIEATIKKNPRIQELLTKYNIPAKINMEELENLKRGHMNSTRVVSTQIYSSLPAEVKKSVDLSSLQEAAILHDYGKVLIPNNILNKKGKFTPQEREIMNLHSELGYELLKDKGLSEKTLNLIKYHHQDLKGSGYPAKVNNDVYDINTEILTTADKFCALREKRCYKNPLAKFEALEIIAKDVNDGKLSQEVYTALIKSV
jgi:HD-GYP domain-containing protein (c-di-GMP phosphodiesterase class II)